MRIKEGGAMRVSRRYQKVFKRVEAEYLPVLSNTMKLMCLCYQEGVKKVSRGPGWLYYAKRLSRLMMLGVCRNGVKPERV